MTKIKQSIILALLSFLFIVIAIVFSIAKEVLCTSILAGFSVLTALLSICLAYKNLKNKD